MFKPSKAVLIASLALGLNQGAFAVGFYDTFDSETVGNLPSTWTVVATGGSNTFLTTNAASDSAPHSFQTASPNNEGYETARFFDPVSAATGYGFGYSLNVTNITDGATNGNAGFTITLGQGSPGGFVAGAPPTDIRVFSVAGSTSQYWLYQPTLGQVSGPLNINSFFDVFVEIVPTSPTDGTSHFYLNGYGPAYEIFAVPYTGFAGNPINGVRIDANTGTGTPGNNTYLLDNVFVVPEPASFGLLSIGGLLMVKRKRTA